MTGPTIAERIEHRRHDEVRECFCPGCKERARAFLYANGPLLIANRRLDAGDWLDFCWPHYEEFRSAVASVPLPQSVFSRWRALALLWITSPT